MVLGRNLEARTPIQLPASDPPSLLVVVDTEEEFDWDADFDRSSVGVSAVDHLWRAQQVCEEFGLVPTYVIDYPMASTPRSIAVLDDLRRRGVAQIGIHLHPWVNPPYSEEVNRRNSYQGNLDPQLEHAKLHALYDQVVEAFGFRPTIHKAGRYGFGPATAATLRELGIEFDLSAAPPFDFTADGGPDYSNLDNRPYRYEGLFGIPTTGGFMGPLHGLGARLYSHRAQSALMPSLLTRVLSRPRLLDRALLSPEGHSLNILRRLTADLHARGDRVFTFSFHSPTVKPGCTPYTATESQVTDFLDCCRRYFEFFMGTMDGQPATPEQVRDRVLALETDAAA